MRKIDICQKTNESQTSHSIKMAKAAVLSSIAMLSNNKQAIHVMADEYFNAYESFAAQMMAASKDIEDETQLRQASYSHKADVNVLIAALEALSQIPDSNITAMNCSEGEGIVNPLRIMTYIDGKDASSVVVPSGWDQVGEDLTDDELGTFTVRFTHLILS